MSLGIPFRTTVRPEPVEGLFFTFLDRKEGQGFDSPGSGPGPNGVAV